MRARFAVLAVLLGLSAPALLALRPAVPPIAHTQLKPGQKAPGFTLLDDHFQPVSLRQFRGKKNVILAIYVLAFTSG